MILFVAGVSAICPQYIQNRFYDTPALYNAVADYQLAFPNGSKLVFNLVSPVLTQNCSFDPEKTQLAKQLVVPSLPGSIFKSPASAVIKDSSGCTVISPYTSKDACSFSMVTRSDGGSQQYLAKNLSKDFQLWLTCGSSVTLSSVSISKAGPNSTQTLAVKMSSPALCGITLPPFAHTGFSSVFVAILFWASGLFLLVLGQRYLRLSIFVSGSNLVYLIIASILNVREVSSPSIFTITLLLISLQFSIAMLLYPRLGVLAIGLLSAAVISLLLQSALLNLTGSLLGFYITVGILGLIMGLICVMSVQQTFISICSSVSGAYLFIRPLGFWFGDYPPQFQIYQTSVNFYFFFAAMILLIGVGIAIQRCIYRRHKKYIEQDRLFRQVKQPVKFKQFGKALVRNIGRMAGGVVEGVVGGVGTVARNVGGFVEQSIVRKQPTRKQPQGRRDDRFSKASDDLWPEQQQAPRRRYEPPSRGPGNSQGRGKGRQIQMVSRSSDGWARFKDV